MKKRKKNSLNVLTYGYLPLTYGKNWFYDIGQFFRNIKYAFQRIIRGYCDQDIGNLDYFYSELFYQSLNQLAENTHGYPGVEQFSDNELGFEGWQNYLRTMAEHFRNTQEDNLEVPINQEIEQLFNEMSSYVEYSKELGDSMHKCYKDKDMYDKLNEEGYNKELQAAEFREQEKNLAFDMMKKGFFSLGD